MQNRRKRSWRLAAALGTAALLVGACSNASTGGSSGGGNRDTQGITKDEIRIGGLAALTGPLGNQYAGIFDGVQAYFDMVNAQGGVNGRKLVLAEKLDDSSSGDINSQQAQALNERDKLFAVVGVATPNFGGGKYLGSNGVPTFGWNVNPEWSDGPSLFGEKGSFLDFTGAGAGVPYLVNQLHLSRVAILAYTAVQSRDCATGFVKSFRKFGIDVALKDTSLPFGVTSLTTDVSRMKQRHVQFVTTCMDPTGNTLLSSTLKQQKLGNVVQYWPNGYDSDVLARYKDLMEGVYLSSMSVPFEDPQASPGIRQFLAQLHARFPKSKPAEVRLAGWLDADLFVRGLRAVGPDVTRSKLVAAINNMTDWTADGIIPPINWKIAHHDNDSPDCMAYLQVKSGAFTPVLGRDGTPFVCFPPHGTSIAPIPLPTTGSPS
jgi:ABC-type branched-subunit amino acid transport system substrate-binding protein